MLKKQQGSTLKSSSYSKCNMMTLKMELFGITQLKIIILSSVIRSKITANNRHIQPPQGYSRQFNSRRGGLRGLKVKLSYIIRLVLRLWVSEIITKIMKSGLLALYKWNIVELVRHISLVLKRLKLIINQRKVSQYNQTGFTI